MGTDVFVYGNSGLNGWTGRNNCFLNGRSSYREIKSKLLKVNEPVVII